ncbi:MAG: helix-turn-helix domain-containing protein [Butyrivibrio sp.]|uniref:helix-turn-helix domain-containing protein n=1 Tax=Butyrivibrio sp. TaxID=28121 RepID=UPI0025D1187F|nr:helix-turn-helix domain-containing protein [Butyrivibrio sp.]MCR5771414.1 helix-turn-helix domain-containing protein [Butyrivibrio sp.]
MGIELFLNDKYKLLKLLYDNQTLVLNKKVIPLTQQEISEALGMSKAKVNSLIGDLQENGYIALETRGKYLLLEKGILMVEDFRKTEAKLNKYSE